MYKAYAGFPVSWLSFLRCHQTGCDGRLATDATQQVVMQGSVHCVRCATSYRIQDGVLRMLDRGLLDAESDNERSQRDRQAQAIDHSWESTEWVQMEIEPTLEASSPLERARVLELGAGTGRYSVRMAERGARLLATDFSFHALQSLAHRVQPGWDVALVEADCTRLQVEPAAFDLVASTLMSNLPTAQHREAVYQLAATAARDGGKFVFSAHHYSWRSLWRGQPQSGHYKAGGIYRYLFKPQEIRQEAGKFFGEVDAWPVQIHVPLSAKLRVQLAASRWSERVWPLNRLGELLLVAAKRPLRTFSAFVAAHLPWWADMLPFLEDVSMVC